MKYYIKRILSIILSIVMITGSFTAPTFADEPISFTAEKPSIETFLSLDDFQSNSDEFASTLFNNVYNLNGGKVQPVTFGPYYKWDIAGYEEIGETPTLVLFSKTSVGYEYFFYRTGWYLDDVTYKNSTIIKPLNGGYGENIKGGILYSSEEIKKVKLVSIKDGSTVIENNLLYLAKGDYGDTAITVGSEDQFIVNSDNLSKVNMKTNYYWLRTTSGSKGLCVNNCHKEINYSEHSIIACVDGKYTHSDAYDVVPAMNLNLSSVLFASAAPASTEGLTFADENTMSFRFDSAKDENGEKCSDRIASTVAYDNKQVRVKCDPSDTNLYLYVQGNDGTEDFVFSTKVTQNTKITAEQIKSGLTNLSGCKIWIEKANGSINYAKTARKQTFKTAITEFNDYNESFTFNQARTNVEIGTMTDYNFYGDVTYSASIYDGNTDEANLVTDRGISASVSGKTIIISTSSNTPCRDYYAKVVGTDNIDTVTKYIKITVEKIKVPVPTINENLQYNGEEQIGINEVTGVNYEGDTYGTNVGTYYCTVKLKNKTNYAWDLPNPKSDDLEITWDISKRELTITALNKTGYVDEAVPLLGNVLGTDYTVEGLLTGDSLNTLPTLTYKETPDMSKEGTEVIEIKGAKINDSNYNIIYKNGILTVNAKSAQTITFDESTITKKYGDDNFTIAANHTVGDGSVTYSSSNENVATVNISTGRVTIKGVGTSEIIATAEKTDNYGKAIAKYTLTVEKSNLEISDSELKNGLIVSELTYGDKLSESTFTGGSSQGTFAWKDGDEILDAGTYTKAVVFTPTDKNYNPIQTTFEVKVNKAKSEEPEISEDEGYVIDYASNTIVAESGYEISSSDEELIPIKDNKFKSGEKYYVRKAGDNNHDASDWVEISDNGLDYGLTASKLTYGQKLSESIISGGSPRGTFKWKDGTIVPESGTTKYITVFTSKDNSYTAECEVEVIVEKAYLSISDADLKDGLTASELTYGNKLSESTFAGGSSEGTYAWKNGDEVLDAGTHAKALVFTPADKNYNPKEITFEVKVKKADLPISDADLKDGLTASELTYGDKLSASTLAGGSSEGTYAWKNGDEILDTGTHAKAVVFTPTDQNYNPKEITFEVKVKKADLPISDADLKDGLTASELTYGNKLSESTFAGGSSEGTYAWKNGDEVLDAGTHAKALVFTPADKNYNPKEITFEVKVKKADLPISDADLKDGLTASELTYGNKLSESTFAGGSPEGTYAWKNGDEVLDAGTYTKAVVFTPTDKNYNPIQTTFEVKVNKAKSEEPEISEDEGYVIDYASNTIVAESGYEISSSNEELIPIKDNKFKSGEKYYVRKAGDNNHDASDWVEISDNGLDYGLTASKLTYGQKLSESIISSGGLSEGEFAWKNGSLIPESGTNKYIAVFTSKDNSYTAECEIEVTVEKADLPISDADLKDGLTASELTYGDKLSESTFAGGSTEGTYAWKNGDEVLDAGTYTKALVFTPADKNYNPKEITFEVTVNKTKYNAPDLSKEDVYTVNYSYNTLAPNNGYEISSTSEKYLPLNENIFEPGQKYYARKAADKNHYESDWTKFSLNEIKLSGEIENGVFKLNADGGIFYCPEYTEEYLKEIGADKIDLNGHFVICISGKSLDNEINSGLIINVTAKISLKNATTNNTATLMRDIVRIGSIYYSKLSDAIDESNNGDTITLLSNSDENIELSEGKIITFDKNGFEWSGKNTGKGSISIIDYVASLYSKKDLNRDGTVKFGSKPVGNYDTLAQALEASEIGDCIKLLNDIKTDSTGSLINDEYYSAGVDFSKGVLIYANKSILLDLNGHTVYGDIYNNGVLTIMDSTTTYDSEANRINIGKGTITGNLYKMPGGLTIIKSGIFNPNNNLDKTFEEFKNMLLKDKNGKALSSAYLINNKWIVLPEGMNFNFNLEYKIFTKDATNADFINPESSDKLIVSVDADNIDDLACGEEYQAVIYLNSEMDNITLRSFEFTAIYEPEIMSISVKANTEFNRYSVLTENTKGELKYVLGTGTYTLKSTEFNPVASFNFKVNGDNVDVKEIINLKFKDDAYVGTMDTINKIPVTSINNYSASIANACDGIKLLDYIYAPEGYKLAIIANEHPEGQTVKLGDGIDVFYTENKAYITHSTNPYGKNYKGEKNGVAGVYLAFVEDSAKESSLIKSIKTVAGKDNLITNADYTGDIDRDNKTDANDASLVYQMLKRATHWGYDISDGNLYIPAFERIISEANHDGKLYGTIEDVNEILNLSLVK